MVCFSKLAARQNLLRLLPLAESFQALLTTDHLINIPIARMIITKIFKSLVLMRVVLSSPCPLSRCSLFLSVVSLHHPAHNPDVHKSQAKQSKLHAMPFEKSWWAIIDLCHHDTKSLYCNLSDPDCSRSFCVPGASRWHPSGENDNTRVNCTHYDTRSKYTDGGIGLGDNYDVS